MVTENDIQYYNGFAETYDPRLDPNAKETSLCDRTTFDARAISDYTACKSMLNYFGIQSMPTVPQKDLDDWPIK